MKQGKEASLARLLCFFGICGSSHVTRRPSVAERAMAIWSMTGTIASIQRAEL
jgi:hypothetical protein